MSDERSEGAADELTLVPLCVMHAVLGESSVIGKGPLGSRVVVDVVDSTWEGERLRGTQAGRAGGDWFLIGAGGVGTVDVRLTIRTHDDALIYVAYRGRTQLRQGGSHVNYVAPLFETADERYSWLNAIQAVGRGDHEGDDVVYRFYELR